MTPHDLTGGLDPGQDYFCPAPPADPQFRDSATLWILDNSGEFALPRVTLDASAGRWDWPALQLNFVAQGGEVMRVWSEAPGGVALDAAGNAASRNAGTLRFTCVEPFRRWTLAFDGMAIRGIAAAEPAALGNAEAAPLSFHVEAEMAAPPWLMGGMNAEAARTMRQGGAALMGGVRYEQLCRIRGTIAFGGRARDIDATGMRVRRQGVRNMAAALGHCQHSALFASGRAFGAIIMAPGPEGPEVFNEAFLLLEDGSKLAARVVSAPWMTRLGGGDDASLVLASAAGEVRITGATLLSMYDHHDFEMASTSVLHQGTARYVWDGETAIGLIERCTRRQRLHGI